MQWQDEETQSDDKLKKVGEQKQMGRDGGVKSQRMTSLWISGGHWKC